MEKAESGKIVYSIYEEFGKSGDDILSLLHDLYSGTVSPKLPITIDEGYDEDGLKDVHTLLRGKGIGDGSEALSYGKVFVHHDATSGAINVGWLSEIGEGNSSHSGNPGCSDIKKKLADTIEELIKCECPK